MSREIKFRAWAYASRKMFYPDDDGIIIAKGCVSALPNTTLMQFTGLKDKNGKKIYEGDIIRSKPLMFDTGKCIIAQVKWDERRAMWMVEEIDPNYKEVEYLHEVLNPAHESEIIGNIYETTEKAKP
jgi:uncharacterized phage protein (TIGR01671 family)